MVNKLTDQLSWTELVDRTYDKIRAFVKDEKAFKAWMMKKEYLGYLFDYQLYGYCYLIYARLLTQQDYCVVIVGKEGKGKSTLAKLICSLIYEGFSKDNLHFEAASFISRLRVCKPGEAQQIDEGGLSLFSREAMSGTNRNMVKVFMAVRKKRQLLVILIPSYGSLDTYVRQHRLNLLIDIIDKGKYKAYFGDALNKVQWDWPKTKNLSAIKVPSDYFFQGYFNYLPGNISFEDYEAKKDLHIDQVLAEMEGDVGSKKQLWVKLPEAARILGIRYDHLWQLVHKGEVPARKMGVKWVVSTEFLEQKTSTPLKPKAASAPGGV